MEKKFNLSKQEKKELAEHFYKEEEDRWSSVQKAYYCPQGAPGRLSEELLDQWHRKHNTGATHPLERKRVMVKIEYGEGAFSVKYFLTNYGAKNYIEAVGQYGLESQIVDEGHVSNLLKGLL